MNGVWLGHIIPIYILEQGVAVWLFCTICLFIENMWAFEFDVIMTFEFDYISEVSEGTRLK